MILLSRRPRSWGSPSRRPRMIMIRFNWSSRSCNQHPIRMLSSVNCIIMLWYHDGTRGRPMLGTRNYSMNWGAWSWRRHHTKPYSRTSRKNSMNKPRSSGSPSCHMRSKSPNSKGSCYLQWPCNVWRSKLTASGRSLRWSSRWRSRTVNCVRSSMSCNWRRTTLISIRGNWMNWSNDSRRATLMNCHNKSSRSARSIANARSRVSRRNVISPWRKRRNNIINVLIDNTPTTSRSWNLI